MVAIRITRNGMEGNCLPDLLPPLLVVGWAWNGCYVPQTAASLVGPLTRLAPLGLFVACRCRAVIQRSGGQRPLPGCPRIWSLPLVNPPQRPPLQLDKAGARKSANQSKA